MEFWSNIKRWRSNVWTFISHDLQRKPTISSSRSSHILFLEIVPAERCIHCSKNLLVLSWNKNKFFLNNCVQMKINHTSCTPFASLFFLFLRDFVFFSIYKQKNVSLCSTKMENLHLKTPTPYSDWTYQLFRHEAVLPVSGYGLWRQTINSTILILSNIQSI